MKGIKDIIVKGSIFAVLTAVFCMGCEGRGLETVWAETMENVSYVDADGKEHTCDDATVLQNDSWEWDDSWYVLNSDIVIGTNVTLKGISVNLILCDGCTLTVEGGIIVGQGQTLNIYCQTGRSGKLFAGTDTWPGCAGIGNKWTEGQNCGTIIINGGEVTAYG